MGGGELAPVSYATVCVRWCKAHLILSEVFTILDFSQLLHAVLYDKAEDFNYANVCHIYPGIRACLPPYHD